MLGSQHPARLAAAVAVALLFALTFGAGLAVVLWGNSAAKAKVRDVLQLLLTAEAVALATAVAWCFAP